jgi:hypothetical protein
VHGQTYSRPPLSCCARLGRLWLRLAPRQPPVPQVDTRQVPGHAHSHRLNLPSDVVARMGRPPLHRSPREPAPPASAPFRRWRSAPLRADRRGARLSASAVSRPVCRHEPRAVHPSADTSGGRLWAAKCVKAMAQSRETCRSSDGASGQGSRTFTVFFATIQVAAKWPSGKVAEWQPQSSSADRPSADQKRKWPVPIDGDKGQSADADG